MARAWSADVIAAAKAGVISRRFLLELETDEGWLRCTDEAAGLVWNSVTYEGAADLWQIEGELSTGALLVPETVTITFDGALQYDDTSLIGRLLDRTWHRRAVILTGLFMNTTTGAALDDFDQWRGRMDQISTAEVEDGPSTITISCESGTFNALSTNQSTVSDADQRRRSATDQFLRNQALKVGQKIPFGINSQNIPGVVGVSGSGSPGTSGGPAGLRQRY
jgi:hypothetical protein